MIKNETRLIEYDFLRILAIGYIVGFWHLDDYAQNIFKSNFTEILTYVFLGLFMYLSGFLLARRYGYFHSKSDLWYFIRKRFLRIYPLYIFALFLFLIFFHIDFKSFLLNFILVGTLINKPIFTLWFISIILFYYLLFPFFIYKYNICKSIALTLFICSSLIFIHLNLNLIDKRLPIYLPVFVFGIVTAKNEVLLNFIKDVRFIFISLTICFAASKFFLAYQISILSFVLMPTFMITAIPPLLFLAQKVSKNISNREILTNISSASFCMYLLHRIIYFVLIKLFHPESNVFTLCYLFIFGMPLIYFISKQVQHYYDYYLQKIIIGVASIKSDTRLT